MRRYDDKKNKNGVEIIFFIFQIVMFFIVYGFVYTSFVGVKLAAQKFGLGWTAYIPVILVLALYPIMLYGVRKMFQEEKRMRAATWMMGWSSAGIVGLYFYLSQLIGV